MRKILTIPVLMVAFLFGGLACGTASAWDGPGGYRKPVPSYHGGYQHGPPHGYQHGSPHGYQHGSPTAAAKATMAITAIIRAMAG